MADSSQKFIARNRAPRVQIEYDVELYGAEKKVQLPFVMGVMSDLSGKSLVEQPAIDDRKFLEIDADNFDDRMKAMAPRAAFAVPNTLTGEGNLEVDLTFEKMSDFSPEAIAGKVDALKPLLEARTQLSNLMAYMDGKAGAETLIETILNNPALLAAVSQGNAEELDSTAALDSLRAAAPSEDEAPDQAAQVLDALRAQDIPEVAPDTSVDDALSSIPEAKVAEEVDTSADVLGDLADAAPEDAAPDTLVDDALSSILEAEVAEEVDTSADVLSDLAEAAPEEAAPDTSVDDALSSIPEAEVAKEVDTSADVLSELADAAPEEAAPDTSVDNALSSIPEVEVAEEVDTSADVLGDLADAAPEEAAPDTSLDDALSSIPEAEVPEEVDTSADVLGDLADPAPEEAAPDTSVDDALSSVPEAQAFEEADTSADVLGDLVDAAPEEAAPDTSVDDLLGDLADVVPEEVEPDTSVDEALSSIPEAETTEDVDASADVLSDLADVAPEPSEPDTSVDDLLGELAEAAPEDSAPDTSVEEALSSIPDTEIDVETDASADILNDLADIEPADAAPGTSLDDLLGDLADDEPEEAEPEVPVEDVQSASAEELTSDFDDLLGDMSSAPGESEATLADNALDATEDLDDLLGDLDADEPALTSGAEDAETPEAEALDDLLGDLETNEPSETPSADTVEPSDSESPDDLVAGTDDNDTAPTGELDDLLGDLGVEDPADDQAELSDSDGLDDLLGDIADEPSGPDANEADALDDLLGDLETDESADVPDAESEGSSEADDLDDLLAADEVEEEEPAAAMDAANDLDDLLADLGAIGDAVEAAEDAPEEDGGDDLEALLNTLEEDEPDGLDDLLSELDEVGEDDADAGLDDLDSLLADLAADDPDETFEETGETPVTTDVVEDDSDLDALLAGLESDAPAEMDELDALLADVDDSAEEDDLDALLGDLADESPAASEAVEEAEMSDDPEFAFGTMGAPRPEALVRKRFRIAIFGDFSGRAARGALEVGDDLAVRRAIVLDPDTVEDVISGFGTTLVLPIGKDGAGIEVRLSELDDLHPDELYEKVELFSALAGLKSQLGAGATADSAASQLTAWAETYGQKAAPPRRKSSGNAVRADLKLSDFQKLIGDTSGALAQASPIDDMLARVVGPHIRALPDPDATAMAEAVDESLSDAMRLVLHHPEFQSIEAQWRSLDLIARSVEVDDTLEVILYDVSAEEIAADLASADDLSSSGFVRLLTEEPLDEENGRGGYSALIGLYTFEETPPHAELLGRIARVAAHVDAPFISAITPGYLEVEKKDRHPLVAEAWDTLRAMPEAGHLALASPRFLLRRPYGAKSEPIYEFDFEEFTMSEGLSGMLWANPAVLVTILLARSFKQNGPSLQLGSVMSLGEMPYHYVVDRHGDQVALPCTERNLSLAKHEFSVQRGYMPVLSAKGRDEIRLGSFNSVAGQELLGPWTGLPAPEPSPPRPAAPAPEPEADAPDIGADDGGLDDLDDLLAGFDDAASDGGGDDDDMDAELAALLDDL